MFGSAEAEFFVDRTRHNDRRLRLPALMDGLGRGENRGHTSLNVTRAASVQSAVGDRRVERLNGHAIDRHRVLVSL